MCTLLFCFLKNTIPYWFITFHHLSHFSLIETTMDIVSDIDSVSDSLSSDDEQKEMIPLWNKSKIYIRE